MAARIEAKSGLSSFTIDEHRFPRSGDYYISPDFATAQNRIELKVDSGVASIDIK